MLGVLRPHAHRDRRRRSSLRAAGVGPGDIAADADRDLRPGYEIVKEPNPALAVRERSSASRTAWRRRCSTGGAALERSSHRINSRTSGVRDAAIAALLERTTVTVADDLTAKYPAAWPTRVAHHAGRRHELRRRVQTFRVGNPENPVSTDAARREIHRRSSRRAWGRTSPHRGDRASSHRSNRAGDMGTPFRDLLAVAERASRARLVVKRHQSATRPLTRSIGRACASCARGFDSAYWQRVDAGRSTPRSSSPR